MRELPPYPEHEKLAKIGDQSQAIGAFLDWLTDEQGCTICEWHDEMREGTFGDDDYAYAPAGYAPRRGSFTDLLALYFGIDLDRIEAERRDMLDRLRRAQEPNELAQYRQEG